MSKKSRPLTFYERQRIEFYLKLKLSFRDIAKRLKREHSVISREVRRNSSREFGYRADIAQQRTLKRKTKTNKRKLDKDFLLSWYVANKLEVGWSPEQVAGRLKEQPPESLKGKTISYESIYQYIYETVRGKYLYQYLRRKRKKRQKHFSRRKQRNTAILDRVSIHERPGEINQKTRLGDWESDTLEFKKQRGGLSVQYERKAQLLRLNRLLNKSAQETHQALLRNLDSLPQDLFKSITFDNGLENANHHKLRDNFGIATYFCDPYSAWQKGGVENINGLIREYLPKKTNLDTLTEEDIKNIQKTLNNRPRKSLGYLTPNEVINKELGLGVVH